MGIFLVISLQLIAKPVWPHLPMKEQDIVIAIYKHLDSSHDDVLKNNITVNSAADPLVKVWNSDHRTEKNILR